MVTLFPYPAVVRSWNAGGAYGRYCTRWVRVIIAGRCAGCCFLFLFWLPRLVLGLLWAIGPRPCWGTTWRPLKKEGKQTNTSSCGTCVVQHFLLHVEIGRAHV